MNKKNTKLKRKSLFDRRNEMARYAYKTVPLYYDIVEQQSLLIDDIRFEDFPIVDKSYYIKSNIKCLSLEYIADYLKDNLIHAKTSGSTGKFIDVYWKYDQESRSLLSLWLYRKKYYDINPRDRGCYFFTDIEKDVQYVELKYSLGISSQCLFDGKLKEAYQKILEYDPTWMILQPSIAILLCDIAETMQKKPQSLRYIELTGEYLRRETRNRIKKIFSCLVANQYGMKEVNSIAYECPEGKMHVMSDNVFVEIIPIHDLNENIEKEFDKDIVSNTKQNYGNICVTTLQNKVMPLIRFKVEDRGILYKNVKCDCGQCGDILELLTGRDNEMILCRDGKKIHSYALIQIIQQINREMDDEIIQFQIVQREYEMFEVYLVLEEMLYANAISFIIKERFRNKLGEETVVLIEIKNQLLPQDKSGKLASFFNCICK